MELKTIFYQQAPIKIFKQTQQTNHTTYRQKKEKHKFNEQTKIDKHSSYLHMMIYQKKIKENKE